MIALITGRMDSLGAKLTGTIQNFVQTLMMGYLCIRAAYFDRSQGIRTIFSVVSAQVYFTGWQALPIISTLAVGAGAAVILQAGSQINLLGGIESIGTFMMVIVIRELAPLLTALIVVARSGTAVASEIGSMQVQREVDALESMGINPLSYIVFPRLMGGIISVVCLAFYFNLIAILGGYVITVFSHQMDFVYYLGLIIEAVSPEDFFLFFTKNIFSGAIIFLVCCRQGLSVVCSSHEVPQVTTKAVFMSIKYIVGFHICVTALFYFNRLIQLGVL